MMAAPEFDRLLAGGAPNVIDAILRNDLGSFVKLAFQSVTPGARLVWGKHLDVMCAALAKVVSGEIPRLIITIPPRHLKSICGSVALPAFFLGHNPSSSVMVVSYGQDLARKFGDDTRKLMLSPDYQRLFPTRLVSVRSSPDLLKTIQGGERRATSLTGTATGAGADLLIFDDPQKPLETYSDALRRTTNSALENTFLSRRNDIAKTRMVIIMQRLHEDDFVGHALAGHPGWTVINLPALAEDDEIWEYETFLGTHIWARARGEALHPERTSVDLLMELRASLGEAIWASQYQQRPAPAGGGLVKVDWFKTCADADLPTDFDRILQSWDTANKVEQWHDFSVCTTWGVKGKNCFLLHVFRERLIYPDLKRAVLRQASLFGATTVLVEDHASGTQLIQELRQEGFGQLRGVKSIHDKKTRMINQTALIETGRVYVAAEAPWLPDYLHELAVFPNGKFDDQVDSTSQALDSLSNWTDGHGLLEFAIRELETQKAAAAAIWVVKPPGDINMAFDTEGWPHYLQPDGCFHLSRDHAVSVLRLDGWSRVG